MSGRTALWPCAARLSTAWTTQFRTYMNFRSADPAVPKIGKDYLPLLPVPAHSDPVALDPELLVSKERKFNSRRSGVIAIKRGMTTLWDQHACQQAVTILQLVDCQVLRTRFEAQCGAYMVEVGAENLRSTNSRRAAQIGHFRRWAIHPKRYLASFQISPDAYIPAGTPLLATHFIPGQYVDCQAKSVAKGFQGVMKRWNFKGQPASHGVSLTHRSGGSTGNRKSPARVFPGKKMPGKLGNETVTVHNLLVMKIDTAENLIYLKGAVPGTVDRPVRIKDAVLKVLKGTAFPKDNMPPFPTHMPQLEENPPTDVPRELFQKVPSPLKVETDPFQFQIGERNRAGGRAVKK